MARQNTRARDLGDRSTLSRRSNQVAHVQMYVLDQSGQTRVNAVLITARQIGPGDASLTPNASLYPIPLACLEPRTPSSLLQGRPHTGCHMTSRPPHRPAHRHLPRPLHRRRSMFARRAIELSRPADISPDTLEFTQVKGIINALFLDAKRAARGRTTFNNSKFDSSYSSRISVLLLTLPTSDYFSYRIHLSPGSRRSSGRAAARSSANGARRVRTVSVPSVDVTSVVPPLSPPPLEPSRPIDNAPPDSPPPLAPATLPVAYESCSPRSGADSASPEPNYPILSPMSHSVNMVATTSQYTYRTLSTSYQEDENDAYGYPAAGSYASYSSHNEYPSAQSLSTVQTPPLSQLHTRENSPASALSSRHSISHISHSYISGHSGTSTITPPSPASPHPIPSHSSAPPSPPYSNYTDTTQSAPYSTSTLVANSHLPAHNLSQSTYTLQTNASRYTSPPRTLPPIHDEREYQSRRGPLHRNHSAPYIHHPQPMSTDFGYTHTQLAGLTHGAWKTEHGMRRGLVG